MSLILICSFFAWPFWTLVGQIRLSCCFAILVLATWVILSIPLPKECNSAATMDGLEYALIISTGVAGWGALWTWLVAPSKHILQVSYFLMFNWIQGLHTLHFTIWATQCSEWVTEWIIAADQEFIVTKSTDHDASTFLRIFLFVSEILCLQALVQKRFRSLWSPLYQKCCCKYLTFEAVLLCLSTFALVMVKFIQHTGAFESLDWLMGTYMCIMAIWFICTLLAAVTFLGWVMHVLTKLCCIHAVFQRALRVVLKEDLADVAMSLRSSRREVLIQAAGVAFSLVTSCVLVSAVLVLALQGASLSTILLGSSPAMCANFVLTTLGALLLSGAYRFPCGTPAEAEASGLCCCRRRKLQRMKPKLKKTDKGTEWDRKTQELAVRGISLHNLLLFYKQLSDSVMPSFQPSVHTTNDVVRLAIIPLTARSCSSYAELVNQHKEVLPQKMVTHNWSNLFRDLLASVVADALGELTFEFIAELLSDTAGVNLVQEMLKVQGRLHNTYWICAFAVNQHSGICGANARGDLDPVTMIPHPICCCNAPKIFNKTPPLNPQAGEILSIFAADGSMLDRVANRLC